MNREDVRGEPLSAQALAEESGFEETLRPRSLAEFVGQTRIRENLDVFLEAARGRGEAVDHLICSKICKFQFSGIIDYL